MLIKLVVKIYSLKLISVYQGYTLIVFMTQGYLTAKRLRTTAVESSIEENGEQKVECRVLQGVAVCSSDLFHLSFLGALKRFWGLGREMGL